MEANRRRDAAWDSEVYVRIRRAKMLEEGRAHDDENTTMDGSVVGGVKEHPHGLVKW